MYSCRQMKDAISEISAASDEVMDERYCCFNCKIVMDGEKLIKAPSGYWSSVQGGGSQVD